MHKHALFLAAARAGGARGGRISKLQEIFLFLLRGTFIEIISGEIVNCPSRAMPVSKNLFLKKFLSCWLLSDELILKYSKTSNSIGLQILISNRLFNWIVESSTYDPTITNPGRKLFSFYRTTSTFLFLIYNNFFSDMQYTEYHYNYTSQYNTVQQT